MSAVAYPRPENVKGKFGRWVTADMFHIAQRIQEIEQGDRLFIQEIDPPVRYTPDEEPRHYAIVEIDDAGTQRMVYSTAHLDSRVIEHVQYLLAVPFHIRFAEAEKLEAKHQQEDMDNQLEEALENWGWDFRRQLEHDGFITHRGKSYAKRGVARGRALWQPAT